MKFPSINAFKKSPKKLVVLFCVCMAVMYIDRGVISSLLKDVEGNWGSLTGVQAGAIQSAFVIGFAVCCPLFAELVTRFPKITNFVMAMGFFFWSISAFLCGFFGTATKGSKQIWGYYCFVLSRICIGIGEAAFIPLSVSIIDDVSSEESRSIYQSVLMSMQPVGIALGYSLGGGLVQLFAWPNIFIVECFFGIVLGIVLLFVPIYDARVKARAKKRRQVANRAESVGELLKANSGSHDNKQEVKKPNILRAFIELVTNPIYLCQCCAMTNYAAIIGAIVYWAPTWIFTRVKDLKISDSSKSFLSNFGFSIIVLFASLFGTLFGGLLLDLVQKRAKGSPKRKQQGILHRALALCSLFVGLSFPIGMLVFVWRRMTIYLFFPLLGSAILILFFFNSPSQIALLSCVRPELRDHAISFNILALHVFGDFPSPTVFGWIADVTGSYDYANAILWLCVAVCSMSYGVACVIAFIKYVRTGAETEENDTADDYNEVEDSSSAAFETVDLATTADEFTNLLRSSQKYSTTE